MTSTLIIQFLVLTTVVSGVLIFFLKKVLFDSTEGAVRRLNRETEEVRSKQVELNEKIKEANEELTKRQKEADELVAKMKTEAEEQARVEREKIVNKAREDAEGIINKAQQTKDEIRHELEKEMKIKAVDFTSIILNETLTEKVLEAFNENMIEDFLGKVQEVDMEMINEKVDTADVVVATPLSDKLKNKLSDILQKRLERVIKINVTEDKGIINGMILKFGSLSLDGSLKAVISQKGEDMKERIDKGMLS